MVSASSVAVARLRLRLRVRYAGGSCAPSTRCSYSQKRPTADGEQRERVLSADEHRRRRGQRRQRRRRSARRRGGQAAGEREPEVHRAAAGEQHRAPGDRGALRQLVGGVAGQRHDGGETCQQRGHRQVAEELGGGAKWHGGGVVLEGLPSGERSCHAACAGDALTALRGAGTLRAA